MKFSSLEIQLRVIKALYIREMISHFGRENIGFLFISDNNVDLMKLDVKIFLIFKENF